MGNLISALFVLICGSASVLAADAQLGSPDLQSTPEHPMGWRGDGSGRYPDASPPLTFKRVAVTPLNALRGKARHPKPDDADGVALTEYAGEFRISEWLVLGPVTPPNPEKPLEGAAIPDEATVSPDEGEAVGDLKWRRAEGAGGLDFGIVFGEKPAGKVAYAAAYFHSDEAFKCAMIWRGRAMRQWLNGANADGWERAKQGIKKGWNRILIKIVAPANQDLWEFKTSFFPHSEEKLAYAETNIRWERPMPSSSWAMPVIAGDKIFATSEPNDLVCLDKRDGRILWIRSNPLWYAAVGSLPEATEKPAWVETLRPKITELEALNEAAPALPDWSKDEARRKLSQSLTDGVRTADRAYRVNIGWGGGNTGPTPVSDGKHIYAWFGETGVMSCFELDGKRVWTKFDKPEGGEHGINSSPVLVGDRLIVIVGSHWAAFDKNTGQSLWRAKYTHPCYGSPVVTRIGDVDVLVAPDGQLVRVSDGEIIAPSAGQFDGECASAVMDGNHFFLYARAGFCVVELPAKAEKNAGTKIIRKLDPKACDPDREPYPVGSPVFHDGLIYAARSGWGAGNHDVIVYAFDPALPAPVYRQKLDLEPVIYYGPEGGGVCASLAYTGANGGYIYVMDNRGTGIVFKPGREYKQVARNTLDHWTRTGMKEVTGSTPIFEGSRMYLRCREMFYCIGEK